MSKIDCYLVDLDDCGQIQSAELMYSVEKDIAKFNDPGLDLLMKDIYSASIHSVYLRHYPSQKYLNKGADVLRFYKNH